MNRRDFDRLPAVFAPDAIYDMSPTGLGVYEGLAAIRALLVDWFSSYEEVTIKTETILALGNGVVFSVNDERARPAGSSGAVRLRDAWVWDFDEGLVSRLTVYPDIDQARAAAERLAQERG